MIYRTGTVLSVARPRPRGRGETALGEPRRRCRRSSLLLPLFHDDDVALRTTDCIAYSRCGRQL
jgi:hypothetical protein